MRHETRKTRFRRLYSTPCRSLAKKSSADSPPTRVCLLVTCAHPHARRRRRRYHKDDETVGAGADSLQPNARSEFSLRLHLQPPCPARQRSLLTSPAYTLQPESLSCLQFPHGLRPRPCQSRSHLPWSRLAFALIIHSWPITTPRDEFSASESVVTLADSLQRARRPSALHRLPP